jgi:malate dehydrogenase
MKADHCATPLVLAGDARSVAPIAWHLARSGLGPSWIVGGTPGESGDAAASLHHLAVALRAPEEVRAPRAVIIAGDGPAGLDLLARMAAAASGAVVITTGSGSAAMAGEIVLRLRLPVERVLATGGLPRQLAIERAIAAEAGVSRSQVSAPVIGPRDGAARALRRYVRISGAPAGLFMDEEALLHALDPAPCRGPALEGRAVVLMAGAVLRDRRRVVSCGAMHAQEGGLPEGLYSLPVVIGREGIVARLTLTLTLEERVFLGRV